jgi:replication initiation protein
MVYLSIEEILKKLEPKQVTKETLIELGIPHFTEKTIERINNCATFLQSVSNFDRNRSKIVKANRCMNRFCPICMATKARKEAYMLLIILKFLSCAKGYEFIFLTLTVPNVTGNELVRELDEQYLALKRLIQRKEFKAISNGFIRKTEITYNQKRNDFHPHIHMLIAVNKSYFTEKSLYVSQHKWQEIWKKCKKDNSITQVHVKKANESSFKELAKYEAKDFDMLGYSQEVFDVFYKALKGRKTLTFNGCFQEAKKMYKEGKLDEYKEVDKTEYVDTFFHMFNYSKSKYDFIKERPMNNEELVKYNGMKIMDEEIIEE